MSRIQSVRGVVFKAAAAALLTSSLALVGQAGAWKNGCEHGVYYTISYITINGVNFPVLVPHAWAHCS